MFVTSSVCMCVRTITVDQSELYWDNVYKGSATATITATIPGSSGNVFVVVSVLNGKDKEELFSDSTGSWNSSDWQSSGHLQLNSLLRMNNSNDINWKIYDSFLYGNSEYMAVATNENANGEEVWNGFAAGRYGAESFNKWCGNKLH